MGYRDDLIAQLKDAGVWQKMTGEEQGNFEQLTDQEAAALMVKGDELVRLEPEAVQETASTALKAAIGLFNGALFSQDKGTLLTPAGTKLAEFLDLLYADGLTTDVIEDD